MEFVVELFIGMIIADLIFRGMLFSKREEKWFKTCIPGYNRYTIGKLCDSNKIGIIAGISSFLFQLVFVIYLCFETYLIENGMLAFYEGEVIGVAPSEFVALMMNDILPYSWYILALIAWLSWIWLMRNFSIKQGSSSWWLFIWAIFPIAGYIYFGCYRNRIYIPEKGLVDRNIEYKQV